MNAPDLVLECGDCGRVYGPSESHECRAQARRNTRGHTPGLSCGHVSTINSKGRCHACARRLGALLEQLEEVAR